MITSILFIAGFVLTGIYIAVISVLIFYWMRLKKPGPEGILPKKLSIIIPFRNEETNLKVLLKCLSEQQNTNIDFEIIAVNDHSTDHSEKIISGFQNRVENLRLVNLPDGHEGKKRALDYAIKQSKFEYIVTLDADVVISRNWLLTLQFSPEADMLILPVTIDGGNTFFEKLQAAEFLSLIATTAATTTIGNPVLCNGANLMFKKEKYFDVFASRSDFEISSGDDVFLMHELKKKGKIIWLHNQDAIAEAAPANSIHIFLHQRIRWASKAKYFTDLSTLVLGSVVLLNNLFVLSGAIFLLFSSYDPQLFLLFFYTKIIVDFIFTMLAANWIGKRHLLWYLILLVPIYPVYSILIPLAGIFVKPKWKNRKVN